MINKIFDLSEDRYQEILAHYNPQFAKDIMNTSHEIGMSLAEAAGLPCGEHDQEPYDLLRLFPLSISPDACEGIGSTAGQITDEQEHEVIISFFFVWAAQSLAYFRSLSYDEAVEKIKLMSTRLSRAEGRTGLPMSCLTWYDWFQKEREHGATA